MQIRLTDWAPWVTCMTKMTTEDHKVSLGAGQRMTWTGREGWTQYKHDTFMKSSNHKQGKINKTKRMRKELFLSGQPAAFQIYPLTEKLQQYTWYFCEQLLSVTKDPSDLLTDEVSIPGPHPKAPGFLSPCRRPGDSASIWQSPAYCLKTVQLAWWMNPSNSQNNFCLFRTWQEIRLRSLWVSFQRC